MTTMKKSSQYLKMLAGIAVAAGGLMVYSAAPAHAADFTVTNTFDPGDGICNASCTLSEALIYAGANPGPDTIKFNIPGSGVKTINPKQELWLSEEDTIDGYSQPGSVANTSQTGTNAQPKIEIDGSEAGQGASGLQIIGPNATVKGLVINRFDGHGIEVGGGPGSPGDSANIEGNFIGTDPTGVMDLGNGGHGVSAHNEDVNVGNNASAAHNLISGNEGSGVALLDTKNARVAHNLIGLKKDGVSALGNSGDGVLIDGETNVLTRNSISFNGGEGIDLEGDGPTANDPGDADSGSNDLLNTPVKVSAKANGTGALVKGKLNSTPNTSFLIEVFSNPAGENEGQTFLGEIGVTTDAKGNASFSFLQGFQAVAKGEKVTATATDAKGNTSEFTAIKAKKKKL